VQLGDRPEPWTVIGLLALDNAPQVAGHAVHLLQHGLLHLGVPVGGDHLRSALHRVVGGGGVDAEFCADLPTNFGGTYLFSRSFVEGPTVFGQGAEMQVRKFEVRSKVRNERRRPPW